MNDEARMMHKRNIFKPLNASENSKDQEARTFRYDLVIELRKRFISATVKRRCKAARIKAWQQQLDTKVPSRRQELTHASGPFDVFYLPRN